MTLHQHLSPAVPGFQSYLAFVSLTWTPKQGDLKSLLPRDSPGLYPLSQCNGIHSFSCFKSLTICKVESTSVSKLDVLAVEARGHPCRCPCAQGYQGHRVGIDQNSLRSVPAHPLHPLLKSKALCPWGTRCVPLQAWQRKVSMVPRTRSSPIPLPPVTVVGSLQIHQVQCCNLPHAPSTPQNKARALCVYDRQGLLVMAREL